MEHRIKTPDGRTLAVQEDGDPDGKPVLAHNARRTRGNCTRRTSPTRPRAASG